MPAKAPIPLKSAQQLLCMLGRQIQARRKQLGITAVAAAESAGISRVTWHRVEKGEASVAVSAYANAVHVLGMTWELDAGDSRPDSDAPAREGWLPARIAVIDYPELRKLAWQVSEGELLSPREALTIYERNSRHIDDASLTACERALIEALRAALADDV